MKMQATQAGQARVMDFTTRLLRERSPGAPGFMRLDSGAVITMADAIHHAVAFGTTGSGKTRDFILPGLKSHFSAGHVGLIVDVKGTLRGLVRPLGRQCGREDAIVEIGTAPSATPINLIANMSVTEFYDFCIALMYQSFYGATHNMDFHVSGAAYTRECFQLLLWMKEENTDLEPNLIRIYEMLADTSLGTRLFQHFCRRQLTDEQKAFVSLIQSAQFHPLSQTKDKGGSTHGEQMSFNLGMMRNVLRTVLESPGVAGKFCCSGGPGLDFRPLLEQGKIVALHFTPETGSVAGIISRMAVNAFYKAISQCGMVLPTPTFVCIDEFQEVADLSGHRYSDASFVAMAREFRCAFMAATQSAAALLKRASAEATHEFVSNCHQKVFFFTDDLFTRALAKAYDEDIDLVWLKPNEIFAVRYDSRTRKHIWKLDSLCQAYAGVAALQPEESGPWAGEAPMQRPLAAVVNRMCPEIKAAPGSGRRHADEPEQEPTPDDSIIKAFPELFVEGAYVIIPKGWRALAENAVGAFVGMGLKAKIRGIRLKRGSLAVDAGVESSITFLQKLLLAADDYCPNCGAKRSVQKCVDDDDDEYIRRAMQYPVCRKCARLLGLEKPENAEAEQSLERVDGLNRKAPDCQDAEAEEGLRSLEGNGRN